MRGTRLVIIVLVGDPQNIMTLATGPQNIIVSVRGCNIGCTVEGKEIVMILVRGP